MGSYSVSLDKISERKMDVLKTINPEYAGKTNLEIINALIAECLDPIVIKED
jgi:hypothetical protein